MKRTRVGRKVKAKRTARPRAAARRTAAPARPGRRRRPAPLLPLPEGDRQLADPVEAAQEDARALPEKLIFDRDRRDDDLGELLGEEYVRSVTSGEEQGVELRDEQVPEEEGGPFVESSASKEFSYAPDDGEPEPLPTANRPPTKQLR
jgi:hypothetical protein